MLVIMSACSPGGQPLSLPHLATLHTHGSSLQFKFVYFIHRWSIFSLQLCTQLNIIGILFKTCPFHKICLCAIIICSIKYILYHQKFYDIFKNEFLLRQNALGIILRDPTGKKNVVMFICNCQKMACKIVSVFLLFPTTGALAC